VGHVTGVQTCALPILPANLAPTSSTFRMLTRKSDSSCVRAADLAARTHELSDFLVNILKVEDVGARFAGKVCYHMACHLRGLNRSEERRGGKEGRCAW